MIDIVELYGELSALSQNDQLVELAKLKEIDLVKGAELEKMLQVNGTISSSEFINQQISVTAPLAWQSFIGEGVMGFTIKSLLSDEGGMGIVFHAEQTIANPTNTYINSHKAAIKVLRSDKLNSNQQKDMFFSEASNLMSLDHPNVCSLYGVSDVLGQPCIVMDYIDGQPLNAWLTHKKSKKDKLKLFNQLLNAVTYLHRSNVYHGDLKPHNIMVNDQDHLVVIDLGLSNRFKLLKKNNTKDRNEEKVSSGKISAYSKRWSSPEQIEGNCSEGTSDVYSLGAIMFYLLTGNSLDKFNQSTVKNKELLAIINKSLSLRPQDRYQDANEFRVTLEKYHQGLPLDEYSISPLYQFKKLIFRKPFTSLAFILMVYSIVSSVLLFTELF